MKNGSGNTHYVAIDYLRVIATLLITNSHLASLYPEGLGRLSFGGMFGDCLFFLISGYCLAKTEESFLKFVGKRYIRIYIPYIICILVLLPSGTFAGWSAMDYLFPIHTYVFLPCIITLYPLFYFCCFLEKRKNRAILYSLFIVTVFEILYFYCVFNYKDNSLSLTADYSIIQISSFFTAMLLGAAIRLNSGLGIYEVRTYRKDRICYMTGSFGFFALFVLQAIRPLQGGYRILHWYIAFGFIFFFSKLMLSYEEKLKTFPIIKTIAPLTLEIYLLQYIIIEVYSRTDFYTGWFLCLCSIFGAAFIVNRISMKVVDGINGYITAKW